APIERAYAVEASRLGSHAPRGLGGDQDQKAFLFHCRNGLAAWPLDRNEIERSPEGIHKIREFDVGVEAVNRRHTQLLFDQLVDKGERELRGCIGPTDGLSDLVA